MDIFNLTLGHASVIMFALQLCPQHSFLEEGITRPSNGIQEKGELRGELVIVRTHNGAVQE